MSSILIVGGAGFIGSHTAKLVAAAGHKPVVFDNLSSGHRWALRWGVFEEGDLADRDAIDRVLARYHIDAVIDFAAHIEVGESVRNPRKYFRNNLVNTLNLLDAMVDSGVQQIVFSSTAAVYGDPLVVPIPEDHRLLPVNPYGESKLFVERTLRWYGDAYGLRWAVLRYFNAAGADPGGEIGEDHAPESHLIPLAIKAALGQRGELQVFGTDYPTPDGTAVRDYIHVVDLAAGAPAGAGPPGGRQAQLRRQCRHRRRPLGARGDRRSRARERSDRAPARGRPPPRRRAVTGRRRAARPSSCSISSRDIPISPPSWSTHGNGTHHAPDDARPPDRRAGDRRGAAGPRDAASRFARPACAPTRNARSRAPNAFCVNPTDSHQAAFVELHPNGAQRQVCPFVDGQPSGLYRAFHPGGERWLEGRYENGLKVGRWTQWAADGRKVADGEYRAGLMVEGAPVGFPATCESVTW